MNSKQRYIAPKIEMLLIIQESFDKTMSMCFNSKFKNSHRVDYKVSNL
ncbi:hypothetical protein QE382_000033 [Sphingobacterium zeae]|uniref:Uncharacterized protein n=1 Tax=Sphingobacterium zeae TaxID=1776859 RepID=A0ABU0TZC3_9SPHI|nr:hypothetical protein [Sphingobacterium zeae]